MRAAIERHRGRVIQEKPLEKVRLAYPIKKQSYAFFPKLLPEPWVAVFLAAMDLLAEAILFLSKYDSSNLPV